MDLIAELASAQRRQALLTQQVALAANVNVYGGRQVEDLSLLAARIRHRSWQKRLRAEAWLQWTCVTRLCGEVVLYDDDELVFLDG